MSVSRFKDPVKVRAGTLGARKKWGPQRIVRLDSLEPAVAAAVRALIEADQAAKRNAAEGQSPAALRAEVRRGVVDPAS